MGGQMSIYKDDITNLRGNLKEKIGQKIIIKGTLGRSKSFEKEAVLQQAYPELFGVKFDREEGLETYKYTDVLTRRIDLQVFDGEGYSSIVPPRVEEPRRIKEETEEETTNLY